MDEHVGYIIETLNQTQMADNTIILFHADHGYHLGECAPNRLRCRGALCGKSTRLDCRCGVRGCAGTVNGRRNRISTSLSASRS